MLRRNKHGVERTCSRCGSKPVVAKAKSEYLCNACQLKRKERQSREASYPKCACGNTLGRGKDLCGSCEDLQRTNPQPEGECYAQETP